MNSTTKPSRYLLFGNLWLDPPARHLSAEKLGCLEKLEPYLRELARRLERKIYFSLKDRP